VTTNGKKRGAQGYTVGTKETPKSKAKPKRRRPEDRELFSDRVRKSGRWVFLGLAIVFAFSFVLFGVGNSGGLGLNDLLRNSGGGGGTSTSGAPPSDALRTALETARTRPNDPQSWVAVGEAYTSVATTTADPAQSRDNYQKAAAAYKKAADLKPSDVALQTKLAQAYTAQAAAVEAQIQDLVARAQAASAATSGAEAFVPSGLGTDAFTQAADAQVSAIASSFYSQTTPLNATATEARKQALTAWLAVTKLSPKDPNAWFQMAAAAAAVGDKTNELLGYKTFVILVPNDPLADPVQKQVDSLEGKTTPAPATTAPATSGSSTAPAGSTTTG
jgi:hypothetical protein